MTSRRKFIKRTATGIGAITIVPGSVLFAKNEIRNKAGEIIQPRVVAPSDKINMAFCGIGNRGGGILKDHNKTGMINTTVLCDVDMGAKHTLENMKAHPNAKQYQDFREMFDKSAREFDAVCIGIPDFSHFAITILSMSQVNHVYVGQP